MTLDQRVRDAGLRPTRQRVALAELLFAKGDRHLSAEELHEEALAAGVPVSLATVYNALHQFTEAGLLRILAVEGARTYFDTNTSDHHHFYVEGENRIFDIDSGPVTVCNLPEPPEGMEIANVDIVVRLRPRRRG
ncbi:MAG TPA: Fur family transcriptional regulator [Paracoccus solventivorans]|nr:Fur family transcriptional regulator [Paracoccus solventivorans]